MPAKTKSPPTLTTAESLRRILKSVRDTMRKDKGLNGDLDRLPLLTWIMFLKFLDDLERVRQEESVLGGTRYVPAIPAPYRWRDWAGKSDGMTGPELLNFINQDESVRPDGRRGPGLFAALRKLEPQPGAERREVVARVFEGAQNRMESGYLLREILNQVDSIHFNSREEIHTLSALYETMLREMRDAAGDSGEFYTPRPVVRFMVEALAPQLGETIHDPACGTGGFLVESLAWLERLPEAQTVQGRRKIQHATLSGGEAKPLPYLLCQMNLLLHGLEAPRIRKGNSLDVNLNDIGERDRVDIILTNPPFGGEEERGILTNFPKDRQTAETALLFLQLIMRSLRKRGGTARAGVVVPNGTLFGDGISARIKEELLQEFNLHTVVRLPNGVFAPYTSIPSNLLFFDRSGPTKDIWFYELPLPAGRKNFTKTQPVQFEDFAAVLEWWKQREDNEHAWRVDFRAEYEAARVNAAPFWQEAEQWRSKAAALFKRAKDCDTRSQAGPRQQFLEKSAAATRSANEAQAAGDAAYWQIYNLDRKNPRIKDDITHRPPEELAASIAAKEARIAEIMGTIRHLLTSLSA